MIDQFSRIELLLGRESIESLSKVCVAVFGVGGVGSYATEALARMGVGEFLLVDPDRVSITNLNRQLIATHTTLGKPKVDVMKDRILSINPKAVVKVREEFYSIDNAKEFCFDNVSYIIDAIDTVSSKLLLIEQSYSLHIPMISCMGTGNKLDPTRFEVDDIYHTSVCPLARIMRRELKRRNIPSLKVVYSKEMPVKVQVPSEQSAMRKQIPGSVSFVPPVAGLILAAEVMKDLLCLC